MELETKIKIDLTEHNLIKQENLKEAFKLLHDLYGEIWCEACYDPTNKQYQEFANKLLPYISKANKLLGFKK